MAEVKWIKIKTDIFDDEKIKIIDKYPARDEIIVIWFKLLSLAGKVNQNGYLFMSNKIAYTTDMLSAIFNREENSIKMALKVFVQFGMIEIEDNEIIKISNWEKHQNIEGMDKIREQTKMRVEKHRKKQKEKLFLINDIQKCVYCGNEATGADHIIAVSRGGENIESNKIPCCIECNRIKNDKPLVDFLNKNRERIDDESVTQNEKLKKHVTLCNVTERYTVTQSNATEEDKERDKELDKEKEREEEKTPLIPLKLIIEKWNELQITKINHIKPNTTRYKSLKARISDYSLEEVFKAIESINQSDFLKGKNERNWTINFDWFIKSSNFDKVIEGNYLNKGVKNNANVPVKRSVEQSELNKARQIQDTELNNIDF